MSLSFPEIAHTLQASPRAALAMVDPLARALFGLEVATLAVMAWVHLRAVVTGFKAAPCVSRS
jgi:hypothetical protein